MIPLLLLALFAAVSPAQQRIFAAPAGGADAAGTREQPLALSAAVKRLGRDGVDEVVLLAGDYRFDRAFDLDVAGTPARPLRIVADEHARVVLRGSIGIDAMASRSPTDEEARRLAESARPHVRVWSIADDRLHEHLRRKLLAGLVVDGAFFLPSRFPNSGYANLAPKTVAPEVAPPAVPVGKQAYGVRAGHGPHRENGKPIGWLGSRAEPRGARARMNVGEDAMAGTWQQWRDELARDNSRHQLTGFLDANWLQRSQSLVSVDAETRSMHLSKALAYGWAWRNKDKPFTVFGLLCELDAPGEWHYDVTTRRLFLYPPTPLTAATTIDVPLADGFLRFDRARHVEVRGLDIEHVAAGDVFRLAGAHNAVIDCRVRACTATAFRLSGEAERVAGCDAVDCDRHVVLAGGRRGPGVLEAANNVVDNCHLYQQRFTHRRVGISISGVGNTLRNCLIHNSLGQSVTVSGNDHVIEQNELCNIGFDEGDGGAIYAGGDLTGYGVVYRHNFIHHLMHVPGKVERSGIHLDDLQAGSTCIGNVFYKSAGKGIFMNGGAGHVIRDNVFLNGFRGVYNVGHGAEKAFRVQREIDADVNHHRRSTKENYVGRAERVVGERGWNEEPWRSRYPRFRQVMEDDGRFGRLWPIRCEVVGNLFHDNDRGDRTIWSRVVDGARGKSVIRDDREIRPDDFVDYDALDLRFRNPGKGLPAIPFDAIGLRLDGERSRMPDVATFRRLLRERFRGVGCMPGTTRRVDTGELVEQVQQLSRR